MTKLSNLRFLLFMMQSKKFVIIQERKLFLFYVEYTLH